MKPILLPLTLVLFLFSCTEFQYFTVSSNTLTKNDRNELVAENDTLRVQYHFADYKGQIGISVYNKSAEPIEIDWKKSALILDGKAYSYFNPNAQLNATLQKDSLAWQNRFRRFGDPLYLASFNGSLFIDEAVQFIPPSSSINKVPLTLPVEPFQNLPEQRATKEKAMWAADVYTTYRKMDFQKDSSPLTFRSYLTFRIGATEAQKEFTAEHIFYVSEIWKTVSGPDNFPDSMLKRGDRFYLQP